MKTRLPFLVFAAGAALLTGCSTKPEARVTSNQPGPVLGNAVGVAAGAVVSNVEGVVVGAAQGAAAATKSTFTNEHRVIRTWHEEKTADGRTIRVPVEVEVDENGRPIGEAKAVPAGSE